MSLSEEGQRAAFAAWAASEGITKVGFNPVEAAGVTLGRVWGVRDHHLVLLDREWAIWVASQRSRAAVQASPSAGEREAKIANERDRTVVARCVTAFDRAVAARGWLTQGRGPYEWDDDRFYAEFGHAIDEFRKAVEPLRRIAIDMTNVPKDDAGVADAKAAAAKLIDGGEEWGPCRKCGERVLLEGGGYCQGHYCMSETTTTRATVETPASSVAPTAVGDYGVDPRQTHTGTHPQPWKGVSQPPPAAGEAKWPEIRDSGGRTDFALTPSTRECRLCGGPHVGRAHAIEDEHGPGKCLPVEGVEADRRVAGREQDERERWIRTSERERCARYAKGVDKSTHPSDLADQLLALPENACPLCESTDPKTLLVPCVRMLERTGKVDPWHPQRKPS